MNKRWGKASLADIFFQKLFGKRIRVQNSCYVPICVLCQVCVCMPCMCCMCAVCVLCVLYVCCMCAICAVCVLYMCCMCAVCVLYVCCMCAVICHDVCLPTCVLYVCYVCAKTSETSKCAQNLKMTQNTWFGWNPWKQLKSAVYYRPLYRTFHFANDRPSGGPILGFRCTTPHETVIFDLRKSTQSTFLHFWGSFTGSGRFFGCSKGSLKGIIVHKKHTFFTFRKLENLKITWFYRFCCFRHF